MPPQSYYFLNYIVPHLDSEKPFPHRKGYLGQYLMMNKNLIQNASHAWAETHIDGLGWVGFDVSNGISPDDRYVALATGFDYTDVIPISGVRLGSGGEEISTQILVSQQ